MKKLVIILCTVVASAAAQQQQQPANVHVLIAKATTFINQQTARGNRLVAHYRTAQVWDGIDADNEEAVALRAKIATEEEEFFTIGKDRKERPDMRVVGTRAKKEGTAEERERLNRAMTEYLNMWTDLQTENEKYRGLGYEAYSPN